MSKCQTDYKDASVYVAGRRRKSSNHDVSQASPRRFSGATSRPEGFESGLDEANESGLNEAKGGLNRMKQRRAE